MTRAQYWVSAAIMWGVMCVAVGCSSTRKLVEALPPGTSFQASQTGVQFSPESLSPLNFGTSFIALQLPVPADSGVAINRSNVRATWAGVENTGTVATGPVGDQIQAAGGPAALDTLLQSRISSTPRPGGTDANPPQATDSR
jgi:hypothetical protein